MIRPALMALACVVAMTGSARAQDAAVITPVDVQLEAGSGFYQPWPSGQTIHAGVGYIQPFGAADYWCGTGYGEAAAYPDARQAMAWLLPHAIDSNPLFCIYRLPQGDLHVFDVLVGTIERSGSGIEKVDSVVNMVVGGTGEFARASGVWVGTTSGRGETTEVGGGIRLPASILKLMQGYVQVP